MEDGLRVAGVVVTILVLLYSLNPCFNGRWSARLFLNPLVSGIKMS